MSRRDEVEAIIADNKHSNRFITADERDELARTLASEVDERDAVIDKLLADLSEPHSRWFVKQRAAEYYVAQGDSVLTKTTRAQCEEIVECHNSDIERLHARALEIAGRKK